MVRNSGTQIKIVLTVLLVFILFVFLYMLSLTHPVDTTYLLLLAFYLVMVLSTWFGLTTGLVLSLLGVFGYGGYYFYQSYVKQFQVDIGWDQGVWLILLPLGAAIGGFLGDSIIFVKKFFKKYERQIESLLLTGQLGVVGNDITFEQGLKEEISRARRSLSQFCVVLVDITNMDHLERLLGADATEQSANKLSEIICRNTRDIDKKAKFGMAMHGIILADCAKENANNLIDRMKKRLRKLDMDYHGRSVKADIEIGVGVAMFPEEGNNPQKLLENAKKDLEHHRSP